MFLFYLIRSIVAREKTRLEIDSFSLLILSISLGQPQIFYRAKKKQKLSIMFFLIVCVTHIHFNWLTKISVKCKRFANCGLRSFENHITKRAHTFVSNESERRKQHRDASIILLLRSTIWLKTISIADFLFDENAMNEQKTVDQSFATCVRIFFLLIIFSHQIPDDFWFKHFSFQFAEETAQILNNHPTQYNMSLHWSTMWKEEKYFNISFPILKWHGDV